MSDVRVACGSSRLGCAERHHTVEVAVFKRGDVSPARVTAAIVLLV
jgi:hypothetical protein